MVGPNNDLHFERVMGAGGGAYSSATSDYLRLKQSRVQQIPLKAQERTPAEAESLPPAIHLEAQPPRSAQVAEAGPLAKYTQHLTQCGYYQNLSKVVHVPPAPTAPVPDPNIFVKLKSISDSLAPEKEEPIC